jgi:hypothetical protein
MEHQFVINSVGMWLHILVGPSCCVYVALFPSTSASTDSVLPEDGVTAPKHVGAILMYSLILFLRKSLVHSLVNNKL